MHQATETVRAGLAGAARGLEAHGIPVPELGGKLLRPLLAYAFVPDHLRPILNERFWYGALAVQMVHEASLLHDDILDGAAERRGAATVAAAKGIGPALVLGDHYLTAAYRAALMTGSSEFLGQFIMAVERTVDGEVRQNRATGDWLTPDCYEQIVRGKSGALMGAASCLGAAVSGCGDVERHVELGREVGALYQRIDDLLDYCVSARTGKEPLRDYRQEKWTWVLESVGIGRFGWARDRLLSVIFEPAAGAPAPAERALLALRSRTGDLRERLAAEAVGPLVGRLLETWLESATEGVARTIADAELARTGARHLGPVTPVRAAARPSRARRSSEAAVVEAALAIGGPDAWSGYFRRHAKTFSLAALLFPPDARRSVESLYAYCRLTDDLIDEPADDAPADVLLERLAVWRQLSRTAFEGEATDIPVLRHSMSEAARRGVSWIYPSALLDGVEMDVVGRSFENWADLERYTFGVAGAVGGWMTQLFGIQDPDVLARAHSLGHGMQLTNILRDVGEDLGRGRLYLPRELLTRHGVTRSALEALRGSRDPVPTSHADAMEELIAAADAHYAHAWPGIPALPGFFRRPVAAAASAYRGIHDEVRRNRYDNLRLRAHTSLGRKLTLSALALTSLRRVERTQSGLLGATT